MTATGSLSGLIDGTQADRLDDALQVLIASRIRMLLSARGMAPSTVACRLDHEPTALRVTLELPDAVPSSVENALKVRVLDAVGALGHTLGRVNVAVTAGSAGHPPDSVRA